MGLSLKECLNEFLDFELVYSASSKELEIPNASMIIDFPDPVSPEKILKPAANSKDKFSTKTKFEISTFLNIWSYYCEGLLSIRCGLIFQRSFFLNSEK